MNDAQPARTIFFTVPGPAVGWQRAGYNRATRTRYTQKETARAERSIAQCAALAMRGREIIDGAVTMTVTVTTPLAASWPAKRKRECLAGLRRPVGKPDIDNILKGIMDACTRVVYRDDALICGVSIHKEFGATAGTRVTFVEWEYGDG